MREEAAQNMANRSWSGVSATRVAIGLMLVFMALFISLFGYFIAIGMRQTEAGVTDRAVAASQVVSANAYWISEVASQTLQRVDAALGPQLVGLNDTIEQLLEGLPSTAEVYVMDADGDVVFTTIAGAGTVNVADRPYFLALKEGAASFVSPLLTSRISNARVFGFSKRVERNGVFAGVVFVSFPESILAEIFDTLDLPTASTVSLVRSDGQMMARFPPAGENTDLSALPLFTQYLRENANGTYQSASSPVDGVARVVSYRTVPSAGFVALASVATAPTWTSFNAAIFTVFLIVSPIVLGLVLGCWWIVRLLARDEVRARELQASVDLNTMLFREIHHRVKNNMQSAQALVRMQDIPEAAKRDLQSRFAAMAAMHEHIYKHDRYHDIDAADFIPAVVDEVKAAYGSVAELSYELDHLPIDRDHATPLALLLSELVTNAFKYAFLDGRKGSILVSLKRRDDGLAQLVVRDNGVGMGAVDLTRSMGMRLIRGVVAQMGGTFEYRTDGGTVFEATIALSQVGRQTSQAAPA
jgi:two-component sensor histidine kinase